jgi:hypothetical protein
MRLTQASSAHAPVAPVLSWLVLSKTIVIGPSKIAQLETRCRTPSRRPRAREMKRSLLDLPLRLRAAFFCGYLCVQVALLIRAQNSPDFVFGFQMFNASSELKIDLFRRLRATHRRRARLIPIPDGTWQTKGSDGTLHTFHWNDRVHDGVLGTLGRFVHASYGLNAQLFRLQCALRDVAQHLPGDSETEALVALVETRKNGRDAQPVRLVGRRQ